MALASLRGGRGVDGLTPEAQRALPTLPPAKLCSLCGSIDRNGKQIEPIQPTRSRIELCAGGVMDAAVFICTLCGAKETVPLR